MFLEQRRASSPSEAIDRKFAPGYRQTDTFKPKRGLINHPRPFPSQ